MPQILFDNPNSPEQPSKGVYRWFFRDSAAEVTIYVGCAGNRRQTVGDPSTLKRGIQEAQRSCITSDKGRSLDTDFIVGTALRFLKNQGHDCIWQHISNTPSDERALCIRHRPLLQSGGTTIRPQFRLAKPDRGLWTRMDIELAEQHLMEALSAYLFCERAS